MVFGGILTFVVHYKYGPFFFHHWLDTILAICFGTILGECSGRLIWLEMKNNRGLLASSTQKLLKSIYPKMILYIVCGYFIYLIGGSRGNSLFIGSAFMFWGIRKELKRVFRSLGWPR